MKAIILAAGIASRLRPLTNDRPKCLLKIGNRSLLERTIDALLENNIREIVIVTGYLHEMLESFVQTRYPSLSVKFIHNELYATTNNIYSLWLALPEVQQEKEIILLDSDILFDPLMIKILRDAPHTNCLALDSHKLGEEEIKVIVNGKNQITELSKTCSIEKAIGESIGIEKISHAYLLALHEELEHMILHEKLDNVFYELAFERLIARGQYFYPVDTSAYFSMELDTPEFSRCHQSNPQTPTSMKIVLFCEQKYAINILQPLEVEANKEGEHSVIWYVQPKNIPDFPLKDEVKWTNSIQEIYDFSPDVLFVPCNIVPYYLPGVKIQIFHGYAAEKKDHWVIRRYFDTYFTQGPFFTEGFKALAKKYKDFEVVETGWPRQDWIYENLHTFEKNALLRKHQKSKLALYAPTFSPSLTSLPFIKEGLEKLAREKDVLLILKFHPLTRSEWMEEYRQLAEEHENMLCVEDHNITKYQIMADVMISDTSSTVYEFLLLDKPVITYKTIAKDIYWLDIQHPEDLPDAFDLVLQDTVLASKRKWIIDNYDPYLDGKVCHRMLDAARDYISRHGVPKKRKLNLWRKYTSIKKFGKVKRR